MGPGDPLTRGLGLFDPSTERFRGARCPDGDGDVAHGAWRPGHGRDQPDENRRESAQEDERHQREDTEPPDQRTDERLEGCEALNSGHVRDGVAGWGRR